MSFSSIKGVNKLISKGMTNIYLKVTVEKIWLSQNFDLLSLKHLSPGQFLVSSNFTQISLDFKTSCCSLKIKRLGAKLYVAFQLF